MKKESLKKLKIRLLKLILKFPNISRFISERWFKKLDKNSLFRLGLLTRIGIVGIISIVLMLSIIMLGVDLYKNIQVKQDILSKRTKVVTEIKYWQEVVKKHPDYRDGYFRLAVLQYKLGNTAMVNFFLKKTLDEDPNFRPALNLESR